MCVVCVWEGVVCVREGIVCVVCVWEIVVLHAAADFSRVFGLLKIISVAALIHNSFPVDKPAPSSPLYQNYFSG